MKPLDINFNFNATEAKDIPVKLEVFDHDKKRLESKWLTLGSTGTLNLADGKYALRATLPSGDTVDRFITVGPERDAAVTIDFAPEEKNTLEAPWQMVQGLRNMGQKKLADSRYSDAWMRLWKMGETGWELAPLVMHRDGTQWDEAGKGAKYSLSIPEANCFLQVGGNHVPRKLIALPSGSVQVLIRPVEGKEYPLEVSVNMDLQGANAMLTLLARGAVTTANDLVENGLGMLDPKQTSPCAAAVGGYYLLKARKTDRLGSLVSQLAEKADWLPDAKILQGWYLLEESRKSEIDPQELAQKFRKHLLDAVEQGLPVFTEGFRLLHSGLEMLHNLPGDAPDEPLEKAYLRIKEYAKAVEITARTTRFRGASPDQPDPQSKEGKPENDDYVAWIYPKIPGEMVNVVAVKGENLPRAVRKVKVSNPKLGQIEVNKEDIQKSISELIEKGILKVKTSDPITTYRGGKSSTKYSRRGISPRQSKYISKYARNSSKFAGRKLRRGFTQGSQVPKVNYEVELQPGEFEDLSHAQQIALTLLDKNLIEPGLKKNPKVTRDAELATWGGGKAHRKTGNDYIEQKRIGKNNKLI